MLFIKLLIFFILSLLSGCDFNSAEDYIQSGKSFYQQKNYEKAKLEFKNALQINKQQTDAIYHLALIYIEEKREEKAYLNLLKVLQIDPYYIKAHLKLGQLFLLTKNLKKALEQVDAVLTIAENNLDALVLKASVLLKQKKTDEAIKIIDLVLLQDPSHINAVYFKIINLKSKNYPKALAIVEKALENNNDNSLLNVLKLQILAQTKDFSALEKHYLALIKRFPEQYVLSDYLAKYYFKNKENAKALAILEDSVNKNADLLEPKSALINFLSIKNPQQAEKKLKDYLAQTPTEAQLYVQLIALYRSQNKPLEAKKQLHLLIKNTENQQARLDAKIMLAANETDRVVAASLVDEVLAIDKGHSRGRLLKTRLKLRQGLYDESIADLRSFLKDYPKSDKAMVLLAQAYEKNGLSKLANESFHKALKLNPNNFFAMQALVSKMANNKNFMAAEKFLQKMPKNLGALQLLAQLKLSQKDWKSAKKIVDLMAKEPKGKGSSNYFAGNIALAQKSYEQAIKYYKQALSDLPESLELDVLNKLMVCYEGLKQRPIMHRYISDYITSYPDKPNGFAIQAQLFILDKSWNKALFLLTKANNKWPKISNFYEGLIMVFKATKNQQQLILTYKKALENIPDNSQFKMNLATIYQTNHAYKQALVLYEQIISKQPKHNNAINNLVSLWVDYFPTTENLERALELTQGFKDSKNVNFLDTYGWVLWANGRYQPALAIFKKVISKEPENSVFRYHLAKAYHKTNNILKAISELEYALKIADQHTGFIEKKAAIELLKQLKTNQ